MGRTSNFRLMSSIWADFSLELILGGEVADSVNGHVQWNQITRPASGYTFSLYGSHSLSAVGTSDSAARLFTIEAPPQ